MLDPFGVVDEVPPVRALGPWSAHLLAAYVGGAVLVLEILASRVLAPLVGTSLETYTAVIGVVLAGITIGNGVGGWLADHYDPVGVLGPALLLGGGLATAVPIVVPALAGDDVGNDLARVLVLAVGGFLPPALVLSAAQPMIVRSQLRDLGRSGRAVGLLSAASAAGSLAGTFLAGFYLVGTFPTRATITGLGGSLVALGAAVTVRGRLGRAAAVAASALLVLGGVVVVPAGCERETRYYCVRSATRGGMVDLRLDAAVQGRVDPADPTRLGFAFHRAIAAALDARRPAGAPVAVLHLGGGAFGFSRFVAATRPGSLNRVVEIDPALDDFAVDRLGLDRRGVEVGSGDGRVVLAGEESGRYDMVVNDTLGSYDPPWHLITREAVGGVRRVLAADGIYALGVVDRGDLRLARAVAATLSSVFDSVIVVTGADGTRPVTTVLLASATQIVVTVDASVGIVSDGATFAGDAAVLTDDLAPVERLSRR